MNRFFFLLSIFLTLDYIFSYNTLRCSSFLSGKCRISVFVRDRRCKTHSTGTGSRLFSIHSKPLTVPETKPKSRRKPTWEEIYNTNPLKADVPNVEYHPPREWFTKLFACYATIDTKDALLKRSESWVHHMQWARRSVLAERLRDIIPSDQQLQLQDAIPSAKVEAEYTFLSEDRMFPTGQLLILRANDSTTAMEYLDKEPLQKQGGVSSWRMFEMKPEHLSHEETEEDEDEENPLHEILQSDLMNPFIFLTLPLAAQTPQSAQDTAGDSDLHSKLRKTATERSLQYHIQAALNQTATSTVGTYLPLYANASRVALLGRLYPAQASADTVLQPPEQSTQPPVTGQLLLFNARSRADALRYLRLDPVATASTLLEGNKEGLFKAVLGAVNQQDISGLHHYTPRTYATKVELDQLHYLDPEDLLQQDETSGLKRLSSLPHHFAENHRILTLLQQYKLSFRYDRMTDEDILAERAKLPFEATSGTSTSSASSSSGDVEQKQPIQRGGKKKEEGELGDSDQVYEGAAEEEGADYSGEGALLEGEEE